MCGLGTSDDISPVSDKVLYDDPTTITNRLISDGAPPREHTEAGAETGNSGDVKHSWKTT